MTDLMIICFILVPWVVIVSLEIRGKSSNFHPAIPFLTSQRSERGIQSMLRPRQRPLPGWRTGRRRMRMATASPERTSFKEKHTLCRFDQDNLLQGGLDLAFRIKGWIGVATMVSLFLSPEAQPFSIPCLHYWNCPILPIGEVIVSDPAVVSQQLFTTDMCHPDAANTHPETYPSPHFSPDFVARRCRRAWIQGARPRAPQAYSTVRRGARPSATQ